MAVGGSLAVRRYSLEEKAPLKINLALLLIRLARRCLFFALGLLAELLAFLLVPLGGEKELILVVERKGYKGCWVVLLSQHSFDSSLYLLGHMDC